MHRSFFTNTVLGIDPKKMRFAAVMTNAVVVKGILLVVCIYAGYQIDRRLGTAPLFMLVLLLVGLILGTLWLLWLSKRFKE